METEPIPNSQTPAERRGTSRGPDGASFVPGLVHELRNAAFGFSATLDAFEARYGDREEARRHGAALRRNLERLTGFIEELGAYGDPRSGPAEPFSLDVLLRDVVAACQPLAQPLGRSLSLAWEGPSAAVLGDATGLRQAFTSLIRWALGQAGGDVEVRAGRREGAHLAGHLDGPGLPGGEPDLARVFEPFYFRAAGMGRLALPVARRILEANGGTLRAVPGAAGGIRISFTLPCR